MRIFTFSAIVTIVLGLGTAGAFLAYPEAAAKPMILVIEFALMPSLAFTRVASRPPAAPS